MVLEIKTGIIGDDGLKKDIFCELLSQHGILFEDTKQDSNNRYPCVIILEGKANSESIALNRCIEPKNIIHIDKEIPLENLILAFTGHYEALYLMDKLITPTISEHGLKILNLIRDCYFRVNIPFIQKWYWPNFAKACLIFTHDIDNLIPRDQNDFFSIIKYHILRKTNKDSSNILNIADIEFKSGIKSSFYFFSEYKEEAEFKIILAELKKRGFEIGLHGSLFSFQDINLLRDEIEKLSSISKTQIKGERQHGLNFLNPHTWRYLDGLHLEYDISFYYNDKIGFRNGICHPYHPFDVITGDKFNLIEIPACFMDFAAIHRGLSEKEIELIISELERAIFFNNGCLVVNFHNEYFGKNRFSFIDKSFYMLLQKASKGLFWTATAKECAEWWRKRESANVFLKEESGQNIVIVDKDISIRIYYPNGKQKNCVGGSKILL